MNEEKEQINIRKCKICGKELSQQLGNKLFCEGCKMKYKKKAINVGTHIAPLIIGAVTMLWKNKNSDDTNELL